MNDACLCHGLDKVPWLAYPKVVRRLALFALVALVGVACTHTPKSGRCAGKSRAQCDWEQAVEELGSGEGGSRRTQAGFGGGLVSDEQWERATIILGEAWTLMGEGVDTLSVRQELIELCGEEPTTAAGDTRRWSCSLEEAPTLAGREMLLEGGSEGVVALSAFNLGEGEATELVEAAATRWGTLCAESFIEYAARGHEGVFRGCRMREGPMLVLSRFRPDNDTALWQVSLSVMPAG